MSPASLEDAITLWKNGQRAEARALLQDLVRRQPQDETLWLWVARTATSPDQQKAALLRVLDLDPFNEIAARILAERYPEAPTASVSGLLGDGQPLADLLRRAKAENNPAQREALYLAVLARDPAQHEALEALLRLYVGRADWIKGFALLQKALARVPDDPVIAKRAVDFGLEAGQPTFLRAINDLLLYAPFITAAHLLKAGEIFSKDQQFDVVAVLLAQAAELEPTNQAVLYGLARAYELTDQAEFALKVRQRIADIDRKSAIGQTAMSQLLEAAPYVPLSMRRNTLMAWREAAGLALPLILLAMLDSRLFLLGAVPFLGLGLALAGSYLLVSALSSHEQALFIPFAPQGLPNWARWTAGVLGALFLLTSLIFSLQTSLRNGRALDVWQAAACEDLLDLIPPEYRDEFLTPTCQE